MRKSFLAAGLLACLSLTACGQPAAPEAVAEAPKKSLARQAQFYAGQEQVASIQSGTIETDPRGGVILKAMVTTAGAGWTQAGFLPRVYAATPPDGVYEVDVVAQKPATADATPTPVEVQGGWNKYADGRVKGVKFISKTNEVVAMLPAAATAPAAK